jgi:hypothetical protein
LLPLGFFYANVFPVFGSVVTGPLAWALRLLLSGLCAVLAWAVYRLRPAAWWALLLLWLVSLASTLVTFFRKDSLRELYEKMGLPPQQVEVASRLATGNLGFPLMMGTALIAGFLYLLWVRKYFDPPTPPSLRMG